MNSYLYTGQQFDPLTELYSLRARYYSPFTGRFLSRDTFPVNFRNPIELNRYGYAANNPVNRFDPSGMNFTEALQLNTNKFIEAVENVKPYAGGTAAMVCSVLWAIGTYTGEANVCGFQASASDGEITIKPVPAPDIEAPGVPNIGPPPDINPSVPDGSFGGGTSPGGGSGGPSLFTKIVAGTLVTIIGAGQVVGILPQPQQQRDRTRLDEATDVSDDSQDSCDPEAFKEWWWSLEHVPGSFHPTDNWYLYELRVARENGRLGRFTRHIPTGPIDADGIQPSTCRLIDAKHADNPARPQYRLDSPPWIHTSYRDELRREFERYLSVISTPNGIPNAQPRGLLVVTNAQSSVVFFVGLLQEVGFVVGSGSQSNAWVQEVP